MKIIDYRSQIAELEKMEADVTEQIRRLKERQKQQDNKNHDMATSIKLSASNKYANLYTDKYHFYYGCRHTHCPVHGIDKRCGCPDEEPAFTVHDEKGKLLFCRPRRLLAPQMPGPYYASEYAKMLGTLEPLQKASLHLLHGIGQFMNYINGGNEDGNL